MDNLKKAFKEVFQNKLDDSFYPDFSQIKLKNQHNCLIDSEPANFDKTCRLAGIPDDWIPELHRTAGIIKSNHAFYRVYRCAVELLIYNIEDYNAKQFRNWPDPVKYMKESSPLFFLLLALETVPVIRARHLEMGVSEKISEDSCKGIGSKAVDYYFFNEVPGLKKRTLYWFQHFIQGRLFRCGRLEYKIKEIESDFFGYRNPADKEFRILQKSPISNQWISPSADGQSEIQLDPGFFKKWDCVLQPGDKTLDMHIPGGGGLTLAVLYDSFHKALEFHETQFPGLNIKGFQCESWIISPDLENIYPEGSNLLLLKQAAHLYPVETKDVAGIGFVFGTNEWEPDKWPQKTSIQKSLKHHLLQGGKFRMGGMLLLRDEIDNLKEETND